MSFDYSAYGSWAWLKNGQIQVTFTDTGLSDFLSAARGRTTTNRAAGQRDMKVSSAKGIELDELGAAGELALAIVMGVVWDGRLKTIGEWDGPLGWRNVGGDVGKVEVKTCDKEDKGLLLMPGTKPEPPYVNALWEPKKNRETVYLRGWRYGHEIMTDAFWRQNIDAPAYIVGAAFLRTMGSLFNLLGMKVLSSSAPIYDEIDGDELEALFLEKSV